MKIVFILASIVVALFVLDMIILCIFCTAGIGGYDDEWSSEKAEKIHYIIAPMQTILMIITTIWAIILVI